uniref:Uncharacterized protein n=1 Tax=Oryza brachyantha TaxID=4533 RepID=J3LS85_ORYBR
MTTRRPENSKLRAIIGVDATAQQNPLANRSICRHKKQDLIRSKPYESRLRGQRAFLVEPHSTLDWCWGSILRGTASDVLRGAMLNWIGPYVHSAHVVIVHNRLIRHWRIKFLEELMKPATLGDRMGNALVFSFGAAAGNYVVAF